jgi:ribose transport system substrate-binding protein
MKTTVTTSLIGMMIAVCLSACGSEPQGTPAPTPAPPRTQSLRIAMIAKSATNPIFLSARKGAETAAKELASKHGIPIEIVWMTPTSEDGEVQAQKIAQATKEGVSAILISCSDAGKVTGAIDAAVAGGVPVMTFDGDAAESKRFAFYGVDDQKTGETLMRELAGQIGKKGSVAILAGNRDAPNLRKRVDAVKEEAGKYPGITIVDTFYHPETVRDAGATVVSAQKAHPQIRGWAMVGGWPLNTPQLLSDLGPAKIKIVAVGALPAQLVYVDEGLAPVLLAQPTYMWGYESVQRIIDKVHLKQEVPEIITMDVVRVTKADLGPWARQLRTWGFTVPDMYAEMP